MRGAAREVAVRAVFVASYRWGGGLRGTSDGDTGRQRTVAFLGRLRAAP